MPYEPDKCTFNDPIELIGRQQVYACLTCFKNPRNKGQRNGICYSCSIQCHGDHDLVELFTKRNFTCDCGTTRMESAGGCNLRKNFSSLDPPESVTNMYNHNFEGRFCDCDEPFVPEEQKGAMFQCLLGDVCDEDWFHEECILGLKVGSVYKGEQKPVTSRVYPQGENVLDKLQSASEDNVKDKIKKENDNQDEEEEEDVDDLTLPGLPNADRFDSFICWKCVEKNRAMFELLVKLDTSAIVAIVPHSSWASLEERNNALRKRFADDEPGATSEQQPSKRIKTDKNNFKSIIDDSTLDMPLSKEVNPKYEFSVFLSPQFRTKFRHAMASKTAPPPVGLRKFLETKFPFLLEEENIYEPPEDDDAHSSLLDAGERALNSIPRQQAIKGLEAYAMIKQRLSDFFKPFAEEGRVVTEEDVTGFFQHMDEEKKNGRNM